jgi:hypothetical protein
MAVRCVPESLSVFFLFFFKVAAPHPVFIGDHFRGLVRDRGSSPRRPGATLRPWPLGHPAPAAIIERFDHASLAT